MHGGSRRCASPACRRRRSGADRRRGAGERAATTLLISDPGNPSSVLACCARARENVRILRETLPRETWEAVQALHQAALRPGSAKPQRRDEHLREIVGRIQGLAGLFLGAMNDDDGAAMLRLGRAVERADFGARVLGEAVATLEGRDDLRSADWIGVLRSLTAFQMYRRTVRGAVTKARVVRFLIASPVFPRSLAYCAGEAETAAGRLPDVPEVRAAVRRLGSLLSGGEGPADGVEPLLTEVQATLEAVHGALDRAYFARPAVSARGQVQAQHA
jgi:uncharacterized alpha-E superfamily protein